MFNKKTYTIFIVLFILLIGLSVAAATDNNTDTKTTKTTDTHKNTAKTTDNTVKSSDTTKHVKTDKTTETTKSNKTVTSNITKTERSSNTKSSPDLQPISISTNDVNCNYGDIVKLNVTTDPSGVTDGIITWFIDDDPVEVRNLATTDGSCNLDTSDYDLGVHEIMVDFGVSTTYDNANAYATLTINHTITVTSDNTDLNYNISDNSGDTITLSSADNYARGNINVYVNNVLAKSYSNVNYDDYTITFDDTIMDGQSAGIVPFKLEFIPRNTYVKANNITGTVFVRDTTTLSSSTTDLVNAAFIDESIVHNTVNIASTNTMAHGDIELYINDTYNRTYTDVNWNNYNLAFDTGVGNYTWKLIFKDNRGYIATNNLTGTLRALPHLLLSVDDIECTIGDVVNVPVTILPDVHEGILTWYVDGRVCAVRDLSESSATYSLRTSYFLPGTYELMLLMVLVRTMQTHTQPVTCLSIILLQHSM